MRISIIVAIAQNNAIGHENKLIYWLPNDLKRFKQLTTGNTIIMGRKTFESLPKGALPNRRNIVLSRTGSPVDFPSADCFRNLDEALASCNENDEVFIIGGASVYAEGLKIADRLCLTYIHDIPEHADTFFPEFALNEWQETYREDHESDEKHSHKYSFVNLERTNK
mgnify:CR=1 FL=1